MTIASEQLWEDFSAPLHQFIRRRMPDPESTDDVLQEVFLRIHTRIDTLQQHDRIAAWIYQITRNAIADYYRAQRPTSQVPESLAAADDIPDDAVVRELVPCVRAMVNQLPAPYRDALQLTEYEGLSQQALSVHLGLSFSGAKSRVQRARAKLKAHLLECCHFHVDSVGGIVGYAPHRACTLSPCGLCID